MLNRIQPHKHVLWLLAFLIASHALVDFLEAQSPLTDGSRVLGSQDADIPIPPNSAIPGHQGAGANLALTLYLSRLSLASVTAMQGTGYFTNQQSSSPATLTYTSDGSIRLDVSADKGQQSTRIYGGYGAVAEPDGTKHALPPQTASGGWLTTPLMLIFHTTDPRTSMIDQGQVTTNEGVFHRVTMAYPSIADDSVGTSPTTIVDLYFDNSSHLLCKSASAIQLDSRDRAIYMQVVTYSDYRQVGNSYVPFKYSVTLNGQPQWTLQLNNVSENPAATASYFVF